MLSTWEPSCGSRLQICAGLQYPAVVSFGATILMHICSIKVGGGIDVDELDVEPPLSYHLLHPRFLLYTCWVGCKNIIEQSDSVNTAYKTPIVELLVVTTTDSNNV